MGSHNRSRTTDRESSSGDGGAVVVEAAVVVGASTVVGAAIVVGAFVVVGVIVVAAIVSAPESGVAGPGKLLSFEFEQDADTTAVNNTTLDNRMFRRR